MRVRGRNLITSNRPAENADVMARSIRRPANFAPPEWAKTVVRLRKQLGFHQATFGNTFHCSAMAESRWERGISEPPSHTYIEMGNAAGDPLCWYFWGRAGLSKEDLLRVTPRLQERLRKAQILAVSLPFCRSASEKKGTRMSGDTPVPSKAHRRGH
jgi:transcriptional regulator with XRE-family HTH domain